MWLTAISLVVMVVRFAPSEGCSCSRMPLQSQFCSFDYVMRIRLMKTENVYSKDMSNLYSDFMYNKENGIISKDTPWLYEEEDKYMLSEKKLHVVINRIFKVEENNTAGLRQNSTVAVLHTPPNDGICGVRLERRVKYLIGGSARDGKLSIHSCQLIRPWPHVTKRQRKNLHHLYRKSCNCVIRDSREQTGAGNECVLRSPSRTSSCYERHSACIVNKNSITGDCKWHRNKHLRACKAAARLPQLP